MHRRQFIVGVGSLAAPSIVQAQNSRVLRYVSAAGVVQLDPLVASISRWLKRDAPGRTLALRLDASEALDDQTVVFRLKKPFSQLPFILAKTMPNLLAIMPARLAATDPAQPVNELVGSGPYRFVADEFSTNSLAVLARFEAYQPRDEPPSGTSGGRIAKMDRIEWRVIPEAATQVNALLTSEVDWIGAVPPDLNPLVRRNPNIVVEVIDPFGLYPFVRPNHVSGPTANVGIRRAIMAALDGHEIIAAAVGDEPGMVTLAERSNHGGSARALARFDR